MASTTPPTTPRDSGNFGWAVLGFFIPLVGLILWLVWRSDRPGDARQSRNGFIAGVVVSVVFSIIYAVAIGAYVASLQ
ncbi:MAG: hypothetical protein AAGC63_05340 [Propionicimonas sp.]|nr:PLDc N-terminal domain-containing protein [Propionicimonas sp.]